MGKGPLVFAAALVLIAVSAAPAEPFALQTLVVDGKVSDVYPADLTGDGLSDLLVTYTAGQTPDYTRKVAVFVQSADGFRGRPDASAVVGAKFAMLDTAGPPGGGPQRIYLLAHDGVYRWPFAKDGGFGGPERIRAEPDLVIFADAGNLPLFDFVRDWKGNGTVSAILPAYLALHVVDLDTGADETLEMPIRSSVRVELSQDRGTDEYSFTSSVAFPGLHSADADGDGLLDLCAGQDERIWCHLQQPDGHYSPTPDRTYRIPILDADERKFHNATVSSTLFDLNGDKRADLVIDKFGGTFPNMHSTLQIHLAGAGGMLPEKPSFVLKSEGFSGFVRFPDVNRDGRVDLVMPKAKVGIGDLVQILLTKKVDVPFSVFLATADGLFSEKADFTKKVYFGVDWRRGFTTVGVVPQFDGDFNGDGVGDLVAGKATEAVQVFLGTGDGASYSSSPDAEIACPASIFFGVGDLNDDGFSDFYLFYPLDPDNEKTIRIYRNTGDWK